MTNGVSASFETTTFEGLDFDHDHANDDALILRVEHDPNDERPYDDLNIYASHNGQAPVYCDTITGTGPAGWNHAFGESTYENGKVVYRFLDTAGKFTQSYEYSAYWIANDFDDRAVKELMQKHPEAVELRSTYRYHVRKWGSVAVPDVVGKTVATRFNVSIARDANDRPDPSRMIFHETGRLHDRGQSGDMFEIPVTPEQYAALKTLGLTEWNTVSVTAVLTDLALKDKTPTSQNDSGFEGTAMSPPPMSDPGNTLSARLVDWLAIDSSNPAPKDWQYLRGYSARLQGRVVEFRDSGTNGNGTLTLLSDEGTRYDVILKSSYPFQIHTRWDEKKPSSPANLEGQEWAVAPLIGDVVSLTAEVEYDPAHAETFVFTKNSSYDSYGSDLVEAGDARLATYRATREDIAARESALAAALKEGQFAPARKIFGALFLDNLTRDEKTNLLAQRQNFPEAERPYEFFIKIGDYSSDGDTIKSLAKKYNVTLPGMTREEALAFFTDIVGDDIYPYFVHELAPTPEESARYWSKALDGRLLERKTFLENQKTLEDYVKAHSGGKIPEEFWRQEEWTDRAIADGVFLPQQREVLIAGYSNKTEIDFETVIANFDNAYSRETALDIIVKTFTTVVLEEPRLEDFGKGADFNYGLDNTVNVLCWEMFFCLGGRKTGRTTTTENYDPALLKKLKTYEPTLKRIRDEMARRPGISENVAFLDELLRL